MMETLVELVPEKSRLNLATRIRCLAHVLNLVVKAFLSLFIPVKSDLHPDEDDNEYDSQEDTELLQALEEVDESVETSDTAAIEELLNARDIDLFLSTEEQAMAQNAYWKLNRLGHRIFNSTMLREQLAEIAGNLKISNAEKKRMIRAVRNRLNIEDKHSMLECFSVPPRCCCLSSLSVLLRLFVPLLPPMPARRALLQTRPLHPRRGHDPTLV
ncbi:hypothetical protein C8F01DRAFT_1343388 [Mycena amicta]|nr:hypothetical protein C8F01DRAFT_1343388 [Mycena amicta]